VGRGTVQRLVAAVAAALPQDSQIEAVLFDRKAERVLNAWAPNDAKSLAAIDQALAHHAAMNGSDIGAAFAVAHTALAAPDGPRSQALVIAITDGAFGQSSPDELAKQLGPTTGLDLYALVLSPGGMTTPDGDALRVLTSTYGGSYLAETVDQLRAPADQSGKMIDRAFVDLASWLRPAWQDLQLAGVAWRVPVEVRAGTGFTLLGVTDANARFGVKLRGDRALALTPGSVIAPIAALALEQEAPPDEHGEPRPDETKLHAKLSLRFPAADLDHDLVVLSTIGKVAAQRRQMIAAGGPFTRILEVADPAFPIAVKQGVTRTTGGSALDRTIIKRLLNDQLQPHAYSCYARSLGRMIKLAGTATFEIEMGRGEVSRVTVGGFDANPEFAGCLADAAYGIAPPMPTPGFNTDDRTIVTYALTFTMRNDQPQVSAATDATVAPQAPPTNGPRPALEVDPSTPLGGVRPTP
ncbi:MAG TPA: vWA domain-containing protein, partial [Kofleriaceae bacterium]